MSKRRMRGPSGAIFVPNVSEQTIALKVAAGEWTPFVEPTPPAVADPEPVEVPIARPRRKRSEVTPHADIG